MAIRDNKSNNLVFSNGHLSPVAGATITGTSIDGAHYANGITFFFNISSATDPADTVSFVKFQDSPDDSVWTDVDVSQYIGDITTLENLTAADFADGSIIPSIGVFGTEHYVRAVLEADGGNAGPIDISLSYNFGIEVKPGLK